MAGMTENGWHWLEMVETGWNGLKWLKDAENGMKWQEMTGICWKLLEWLDIAAHS